LHLLTNLPASVSALKVADLYRRRWTIETLFLEVTTTLTCEIDTLCYPKAALFRFCLALVAANAVAVVKAALRAAHAEEKADELSGYYLALEVKQVHQGMMIAVPPICWDEIARLKTGPLPSCSGRLRRMLISNNTARLHAAKEAAADKKPLPQWRARVDPQTTYG